MTSAPAPNQRTVRLDPSERPDAAAATGAPPTPAAPASSAGRSGNALKPGTRMGELELLGVVGEGGFGIVYNAYDHSLQRRVALKEYMPAALASRGHDAHVRVRSPSQAEAFGAGLRSFVNEARLLAQFDHPALVKVYRFWEDNDTAYMVMPLYEGVTLKDKLKRMGAPPDEAWLMSVIAPLTEALAVIHAQHCYHRDIAPDNVLLLADGERPLLLDFGAARRVISDMTQALTVILKPGFAPLEQYAELPDRMKQGPWTDVYALAATVHRAIVGKPPPPAVARLVHDDYQPLALAAAGRYSERFLRAIDNALKLRPDDRTASVDAFRLDLGLGPIVQNGTLTMAATSQPLQPAARPARRSRNLVAGATAVLVLGVAVALYVGQSSRRDAPAATPASADAAGRKTEVVAPVPVAPAALDVQAEFAKVIAGQLAAFKVQSAPASTTLRIGQDRLSFTVSSARDGFVHVIVREADGSLLLLFPNAQASDNAIRAGQTITLPHANWLLDTVEPAGRAEFLVVVSAQPRDYSDLSKERDFIFLKLPNGLAGGALAARWARSTPLLLGGLRNCPSADCEAYGAATFGLDVQP